MGIYTQISGSTECPNCLQKTPVDFQIKGFYSSYLELEVGDHLVGGPYFDGEYCRDKIECSNCKREFVPACKVKSQRIIGLKAYKTDDIASLAVPPPEDLLIVGRGYNKKEIIKFIQYASFALALEAMGKDPRILSYGVDWKNRIIKTAIHPGEEMLRIYDYLVCLKLESDYFLSDCSFLMDLLNPELINNVFLDKIGISNTILRDLKLKSIKELQRLAEPYFLPIKQMILQLAFFIMQNEKEE